MLRRNRTGGILASDWGGVDSGAIPSISDSTPARLSRMVRRVVMAWPSTNTAVAGETEYVVGHDKYPGLSLDRESGRHHRGSFLSFFDQLPHSRPIQS